MTDTGYPSMSIDTEANAATLRLRPGTSSRSERVHRALVADYDQSGQLTSVELLSLAAIAREGVVAQLRELVQTMEPSSSQASNNITPLREPRGWVDLFVDQIGEAIALRRAGTSRRARLPQPPPLSVSWG